MKLLSFRKTAATLALSLLVVEKYAAAAATTTINATTSNSTIAPTKNITHLRHGEAGPIDIDEETTNAHYNSQNYLSLQTFSNLLNAQIVQDIKREAAISSRRRELQVSTNGTIENEDAQALSEEEEAVWQSIVGIEFELGVEREQFNEEMTSYIVCDETYDTFGEDSISMIQSIFSTNSAGDGPAVVVRILPFLSFRMF